MPPVYAKSRLENGAQPTLEQHSRDVLSAFDTLFGSVTHPSRLGLVWQRFFLLAPEQWARFVQLSRVALALHDIGKANDGFQAALSDRRAGQVLYHEKLSAWLIGLDPIRRWLEQGKVDVEVIVAAIAGHHLRFEDRSLCDRLGDVQRVRILDFEPALRLAAEELDLPVPQVSSVCRVWPWEDITPGLEGLRRTARRFRSSVMPSSTGFGTTTGDESRLRLLLAVRAALISSDAVGSGLVRTGRDVAEWIEQSVGRSPLDADAIREQVIAPRVRTIEARSHRPFVWEEFQSQAATLPQRSLLVAPCGAGKTLAAWRWIEGCLGTRPAGHVLFLYPTRGTATEGFRDYVSWAPEADAALVHGTAEFDLEGMFSNPDDDRAGRNYLSEARLFALGHWSKRIFSATVDTFLGAMAHQYGPLCLLPVLADSVVVIDEVHSFSPSMFAALTCFLKRFDVPVLCMTASLPPARRAALEECGLQLAIEGFEELEEISSAPRYRLSCATETLARDKALQAARQGQRVLWVANRVDDCQRFAAELSAALTTDAVPVLCYHSRFRLVDRRDRHEEVIRLFRDTRTQGAVVVSTQVCEMSLDLDADLLVTEVAPVPSLIQRMGRCCRVRNPGPRRGEILVYEGASPRPYEPSDLTEGLAMATALTGRAEFSQADLAEHLDELDRVTDPADQWVAFWNSGFFASARDNEFRESDDFNIQCVLDADLERYLSTSRRDAPGYLVPVPKGEHPQEHPKLRFLKVARAASYDAQLGYRKGR